MEASEKQRLLRGVLLILFNMEESNSDPDYDMVPNYQAAKEEVERLFAQTN